MTLDSVVGNKAAAILKISRHTLYDKLKRYGRSLERRSVCNNGTSAA